MSTVGGFGPIEPSCWKHMHSGNVYHETGKPLKRRLASCVTTEV